jgi:hypothetical protein
MKKALPKRIFVPATFRWENQVIENQLEHSPVVPSIGRQDQELGCSRDVN